MFINNTLYNAESKPQAEGNSFNLCSETRLINFINNTFIDAGAIILNPKFDHAIRQKIGSQDEMGWTTAIFDAVVDQVGEKLAELVAIAQDWR